jgi:hypothetical protein
MSTVAAAAAGVITLPNASSISSTDAARNFADVLDGVEHRA